MTSPHQDQRLSDSSLDTRIPSFLGSPRSLRRASDASYTSLNTRTDPDITAAVKFLHVDSEILSCAEMGDDIAIERCLNKRVNVHMRDQLGRTALHFAVQTPNIRAIELLLDAGCLATQKDCIGMSPLSLCLMRRPSLEVAKLLFDHGAILLPRSRPVDTGLFLLEITNYDKWRKLIDKQFVMMCCPTEEDARILQLLVVKGADINDPEVPGGRSALHFAAMSNNCELIKVLLNLGANLDATNHRGQTPKNVAVTFKCKEAAVLLDEIMTTRIVPSSTLLS